MGRISVSAPSLYLDMESQGRIRSFVLDVDEDEFRRKQKGIKVKFITFM
jgi:hypothetical protein